MHAHAQRERERGRGGGRGREEETGHAIRAEKRTRLGLDLSDLHEDTYAIQKLDCTHKRLNSY
jgi:hypothetical protein